MTPAFVALLVVAAALVLVGITLWLRRAPSSERMQPGRRSALQHRAAFSPASAERLGSGRHLT